MNDSDKSLFKHIDSLIDLLTNINLQLKKDKEVLASTDLEARSTSNIETNKLLNQILSCITAIKEKIPSQESNFITALTSYIESVNTSYSANLQSKLNEIKSLILQGYESLSVNSQIVNENLRDLNAIWSNLHKLANNTHVYDKPK